MKNMRRPNDTSWEPVAEWYGDLLEGQGTYQRELILPNLLRLMDIHKTDHVLDLACGPGFFVSEFAVQAARVIGADASRSLIAIAQKRAAQNVDLHVAPADSLTFIKTATIDKIAVVLPSRISKMRALFSKNAREY